MTEDDESSKGYSDVAYDKTGSHGTVVASKLVGWPIGVANYAKLVVVKRHSGRNAAAHFNEVDCLLKIYDDLSRRMENGDVKDHDTENLVIVGGTDTATGLNKFKKSDEAIYAPATDIVGPFSIEAGMPPLTGTSVGTLTTLK
ncbi:hypothetical protein ABW20_dc0103604 [Dactylellina cionopaga]|nr:hypothetical protein ABW20_dc0103604 [Dactylellina cionopaga]